MLNSKRGDKGLEVRYLQQALAYTRPITIDGDFGPNTESRLKDFQVEHKLEPTGTVDKSTVDALYVYPAGWSLRKDLLSMNPKPKKLVTTKSFDSKVNSSKLTKIINCINNWEVLVDKVVELSPLKNKNLLLAILSVESGGSAIDATTKKPIIRFENHLWFSHWGQYHREAYTKRWTHDTGKKWLGHTFDGKPFHGTQSLEWASYEAAAEVDLEAASKSISIGAAQILGLHYQRLNFSSASAFVTASYKPQLSILAFMDFVTTDYQLVQAILNFDLKKFTSLYNGTGQVDTYSNWIKEQYDLFQWRHNEEISITS